MFIAVWSSILLHTALFAGFSLVFSTDRKSFPRTEPLVVSVLSVSTTTAAVTSPGPVLENQAIADKKNISSPAEQIEPREVIEPVKEVFQSVPEPEEVRPDDSKISSTGDGAVTDAVETDSLDITPSGSYSTGLTGKIVPVEVREPVPVENIVPVYPFRARKKGLEGDVVLEVTVSGSGKPVSCIVVDSSGFEDLDKAAEQSVLASLFYPGTIDGEDTESSLRITIRFRLN